MYVCNHAVFILTIYMYLHCVVSQEQLLYMCTIDNIALNKVIQIIFETHRNIA